MVDGDEGQSRRDLRRRLVKFLETASLYAPEGFPETTLRDIPVRPADSCPFPTNLRIQLPCPTCDDVARTFEYEGQTDDEKRRRELHLSAEESVRLRFLCTHCRAQRGTFLVHITRRDSDLFVSLIKVGQWPSYHPRPRRELAAELGAEAAALYQRGLTVERFGFGIGAFAYYRRVTEVIIDKLMGDLRRFADDMGATNLVSALDAVNREQQASKRIEAVKDLVPKALKPPGQLNPLGTLYAALSDNLHSGTDEECREAAGQLRVALEFILTVLANNVTSAESYAGALQAVQQGRKKNCKQDPPASKE